MTLIRRARIDRPPLYPLLIAFAVSCFLGTLATDIVYWRTANIVWADFSDWLVTIGVVVGYVALVVAVIEIFVLRSRRLYRPGWLFSIGMIVALILATFNMLIHTRDAWTSVVPWGIVLSTIVAIVALAAVWTVRVTYHERYGAAAPREAANPKVTG